MVLAYRPLSGNPDTTSIQTQEQEPETANAFVDAMQGYQPMYGGGNQRSTIGGLGSRLPAGIIGGVDAPRLQLDTPMSWSEGALSGLNNFMQLRNYQTQQQVQGKMLDDYQQQQIKQQQKIALDEERKVALDQQYYEQGAALGRTPEEQHAYGVANQQTQGKFQSDLMMKQAAAPIEAQAKIQGVQEGLNALEQSGAAERFRNGTHTPQDVNVFQAVMGYKPETSTSASKDIAEARKALAEAGMTEQDLQAHPQAIAAKQEQDNIAIANGNLETKLKEIQIQFEPEKLRADLEAKQIDTESKKRAFEALDNYGRLSKLIEEETRTGRKVTQKYLLSAQTQLDIAAKTAGITAPNLIEIYGDLYGKGDAGVVLPETGEVWRNPQPESATPRQSTLDALPKGARAVGGSSGVYILPDGSYVRHKPTGKPKAKPSPKPQAAVPKLTRASMGLYGE
jgi:hypothetical protein